MQIIRLKIETPEGKKEIAMATWGDPAQSSVIFCSHGLTRNSRDFDYLAQRLSQHAYVICPDMVGRGQSDYFDDSSLYQYPVYVHIMQQLITQLKGKITSWVGTSMGGLIGLFLASEEGLIDKLVINDIGLFIPKAALERIVKYAAIQPRFPSLQEAQGWIRRTYAGFGVLTDDQWMHITEHSVIGDGHGGYRMNYDPKIGEAFTGPIEDVDLNAWWCQVKAPRLILRGEHSDVLSREHYDTLVREENVQGKEFAQVGHAPVLMNEEQIQVIERFLFA